MTAPTIVKIHPGRGKVFRSAMPMATTRVATTTPGGVVPRSSPCGYPGRDPKDLASRWRGGLSVPIPMVTTRVATTTPGGVVPRRGSPCGYPGRDPKDLASRWRAPATPSPSGLHGYGPYPLVVGVPCPVPVETGAQPVLGLPYHLGQPGPWHL